MLECGQMTAERPVSKVEVKKIGLGETFVPFEDVKEFLPVEMVDETVEDILRVPIEFRGVSGFIIARANTYPYETFITPLGEVRETKSYKDGNMYYSEFPVDLVLSFNITSYEEYVRLQQYELKVDFSNGEEPYDLPCIDLDWEDEEEIKQDIDNRGRHSSHSNDLYKDGESPLVFLPYNLQKLAQIKMAFVEKEETS